MGQLRGGVHVGRELARRRIRGRPQAAALHARRNHPVTDPIQTNILLSGLLFALALSSGAAERREPITILFSGSANGILRSCHCPSSPWGGLAKRAWLIDQVRAAAGAERVLALDSGDLFPSDAAPDHAQLLLRNFGLMDYQAVAIGDAEMVDGLDAWVTANRQAGLWDVASGRSTFPWLSGGYRLTSGPRRYQMLVPPWTVLNRGGLRIGIVSITGPDAWRFARSKPEGVTLTDPDRIIAVFLDNTRGQLDVAIVLSHQGLEADRKLAARVKGIDLIVGGHSQSLISPPEVVNGVAICQAGKNGENLGILVMAPNTEATPPADPSDADTQADAEEDPFLPTVARTPRRRIAQQIIPLTTAVEDSHPVAGLIDAYYEDRDAENARRLSVPDPRSKSNAPQLVLNMPTQSVVLTAGARQIVSVRIGNRGGAPLVIERVRSKSPWLTVLAAPERIEPGAEAEARFEIVAEKIDRSFRCEFSVLANDSLRRVVHGAFSGHVEGPMPGILDVPALWSNLCATVMRASGKTEQAASETRSDTATSEPGRRALVEYFFSPGCSDCRELDETILPGFTNRFAGTVDFRKSDVTIPSNYLRLARMQERLRVRSNEPVSMYIDGRIPVLGLDAIRADLDRIVTERIGTGGTGAATQSEATDAPSDMGLTNSVVAETPLEPPLNGEAIAEGDSAPDVLAGRLSAFTLPAILLAGFVDGLNPCAFATIIFFITLLAVAGVKGSRLLLVGAAYILAVFCTYLLLGFGALRLLRAMTGWARLATLLRWGMVGLLLILAFISFKDAWAFSRSGRPADVTLQLPDRFKRKIHEIMRSRLNPSALFLSALGIGFLVTIIEAACTGQVYLPTLVMLSRYPETRDKSLFLLVLYNLMFVLPLVFVTVAAYLGTRNQRLLDWSHRNVVWGKLAMGLLFLCLVFVLLVMN